jgi:hypothetical protein
MRPTRCPGYVWCDHHGGIHPTESDYFQEGADECQAYNWRTVYVLGAKGEFEP